MKYTLDHSLPIIEPEIDLIASPNVGTLAGDINRLSLATGVALDATKASAVEAAVEDDRLVPADSPELWQAAPSWLPILSGLYDPTAMVLAEGAVGNDPGGYRAEFIRMVKQMKR